MTIWASFLRFLIIFVGCGVCSASSRSLREEVRDDRWKESWSGGWWERMCVVNENVSDIFNDVVRCEGSSR